MFGSEKSKPPRPAAGVETLIGARVTLRGDLVFSGGLYVEGSIQGSVLAEEGADDAVVTLAERGHIQGEVRAPHVIVNGQLSGDVYAGNRIELGASARIQGNIYYKVIEMAAGAVVTGRMIHGDAPRQLPKPESDTDAKAA